MAATKKQYRGLAFPRRRTYFPHMMDCQRIADLFDRLGRIIHGLQFSAGLNPAQWEALRYLARANRYSRTPGALADFLGTTKGTASQTVIALESKGFISRARAANDRRSVQIDLTESGLDLMDRDPTELIADAAAELLPAEREALVRVMGRLVKSVRSLPRLYAPLRGGRKRRRRGLPLRADRRIAGRGGRRANLCQFRLAGLIF